MEFTTPLKRSSKKMMLLGSGELGKEVAIEAQRLGIEVVAVDRYDDAPAQLVANESFTVDMKDYDLLLALIEQVRPDYILPEVEALNIDALIEAENRGFNVIPNAQAVKKTMNRKHIREFAAKELGLLTSGYAFVKTYDELVEKAQEIGFPCVIKPVMSSSGHGQSVAKSVADLQQCFDDAKEARGDASELIVEEFIKFDYEITLLTVRTPQQTVYCEPIGHIQQDGDYILSWQPMQMSQSALEASKLMAKKITDGLGGSGIYGVELFIKDDTVYFSEVSPRPHDTGMVTLITQSQSEFALHVRAVLGLNLDFIFHGSGASGAYKAKSSSKEPRITVPDEAFSANSYVRIFSKPTSHEGRRLGVCLVLDNVDKAKAKAAEIVAKMDDR